MPNPKTFSDRYPVTCTRNELFVRQGLPHLAPEIRDAITGWLDAHDLDYRVMPVGRPIVRDTKAGTVTYWVRHNGQLEPMQVIDHAPPDTGAGKWPAPFPRVLLEQPVPSVCPTCGRDVKKPIPTEEPA